VRFRGSLTPFVHMPQGFPIVPNRILSKDLLFTSTAIFVILISPSNSLELLERISPLLNEEIPVKSQIRYHGFSPLLHEFRKGFSPLLNEEIPPQPPKTSPGALLTTSKTSPTPYDRNLHSFPDSEIPGSRSRLEFPGPCTMDG